MVDYLVKGKTITGAYYVTLVDQKELKIKQLRLVHKKVLFHEDDVPYHKSTVARAKLHKLGFKLIPRPP